MVQAKKISPLNRVRKKAEQELRKKVGQTQARTLVGQAAFLAREALITELFVNRLRKITNRPIVVVGIKNTGKPYTFSLQAQKTTLERKNIFVDAIKYPSTNGSHPEAIKELQKISTRAFAGKSPILVFVDTSKDPRMPGSFVKKGDSLQIILENMGFRVFFEGYNWSKNDHSTKLSKASYAKPGELKPFHMIADESKIAILLNPSRERLVGRMYKGDEYVWQAAFHDDRPIARSKPFRDLIVQETAHQRNSVSRIKNNS